MKIVSRLVAAFVAIAALASFTGTAQAATGSYTLSWNQMRLYYANSWIYSGTLSPPAGIPANATVTSIAVNATWNTGAGGLAPQAYKMRVCDWNSLDCKDEFSERGTVQSKTNMIGWQGKPAATWKFYVDSQLYTGGGMYQISPWRWHLSNSVTVNYQY